MQALVKETPAPQVTAYDKAASRGPQAYMEYADILTAIAKGDAVEWLTPDGWIYQHPSHTLNEIKECMYRPECYRTTGVTWDGVFRPIEGDAPSPAHHPV